MRARWLLRGLLVVLGMCVSAGMPQRCAAQGTVAGVSVITGVVTDPTGAAVPSAEVRVISEATGIVITLKTNSAGLYQTPPLSPGTYTLEVTAAGFSKLVRPNVLLHVGQTQQVTLKLTVGNVTQQVVVTAAPPLINRTNPTLATIVESKDVQSIPLINRTAGALLRLTPGVFFTYSDPGSYNAPRFNVGATGDMSYFLDGFPVGGVRTAIDQMVLSPPVEAVQEARVETGLGDAQTGMAEGGAVYFVTKSGTDAYHGSGYYYMRNTALDTKNFWTHNRPPDHWYLMGGSIGGPLFPKQFGKRLFFFVNAEGTNQKNPTGGTFSIPTMAERQGDFRGLPPIYDPTTTTVDPATGVVTRQQFSCGGVLNMICPDRFDPVMQKVIAMLPPISSSIANPTNDYTTSYDYTYWRYAWVGKIDAQLSDKDRLSFETLNDRSSSGVTTPNGYAPWTNPFGNQSNPEGTSLYGVTETHIFSPTLINNFTFGYRPFWSNPGISPAYNPAKKWDETLGISGFVPNADWNFPSFLFGGYLGVGPPGGAGVYIAHWATDFSDGVTKVSGKHSLSFGFQLETARSETIFNANPTGQFNFHQTATALPPAPGKTAITGGDGFASALLGFVGSSSLSFVGKKMWREWYWSPYFVDTWHWRPDLTLTLGIRWDVDQSLQEITNNQGQGFDSNMINPVSGTPGVLTFLGRNGIPSSFWNTDWNRIRPQVGFAYAPSHFHNRLAIRGGYGIYSVPPGLGANLPAPSLGFAKAVVGFNTLAESTATTPVFYLSQGFPSYPLGGTPQSLTPGFGAVPVGQNPRTSVTYVDRNLTFGYVQNLAMSVEYAFSGDFVVGVSGQGQLGRKLPMFFDRNQLPPAAWGKLGNLQSFRPFPQYSGVTQFLYPSGIIDWYGATFNVSKHYSSGLSLMGSYQFAKSVGVMNCESSYRCGLSRSAGVFYQHANGPVGTPYHRINVSFVYDLPWGPGRPFLRRGLASSFLGGWTVSSIISWYSGIPFTLSNPTNSLNCFCGLGNRLNLIGNLTAAPHTLKEWFNTKAVAPPAFGQIGTLGGVALTGPVTSNWDAEVSKTVNFGKEYGLKISAEFFNATNTPKLGLPGTAFGTPQFGVISGPLLAGTNGPGAADSGSARLIQLGVHLSF